MCWENTQMEIDNSLKTSDIIEKRRTERINTHIFSGDAVKSFDKMQLKDFFIKFKRLEHKNTNLKTMYKINKRTEFTIDTPFGETENTETEEIIK